MALSRIYVYTDFDGTITQRDLLYYLLDVAAPREWQLIEAALTSEAVDEKSALQKEFDLINISLQEAIDIVMNVPIDPTFAAFAYYCLEHEIPLEILSGGFEQFIAAYLQKHQLAFIPFYANKARVENNRWQIIGAPNPKIRHLCNHCKTYWVKQKQQAGYIVVYIGDGNTDRCPASHAHYRFAKGDLARYLDKHQMPYIPFQNFADVLEKFHAILTYHKENTRVAPITHFTD